MPGGFSGSFYTTQARLTRQNRNDNDRHHGITNRAELLYATQAKKTVKQNFTHHNENKTQAIRNLLADNDSRTIHCVNAVGSA